MYNPGLTYPKPPPKVKKSTAIPKSVVMAVFVRDNWTCQFCGDVYYPASGDDFPPLHCHHDIFASQGGKPTVKNCSTCCYKCHDQHGKLKHAVPRRKQGVIV